MDRVDDDDKMDYISNMPTQCGAVCQSTLQKSNAVYTKQVPKHHRDTKNIPSNVR